MESKETPAQDGAGRTIPNKIVEIVTALLVLVLGIVGAVDSLRLGARWADDGPQAGYFPFYVSLSICLAAVWILVRAIMRANQGVFLTGGQLKPVLRLFIPLVVYCLLIAFVGIYVASVIFIAYCMRTMGGYSWIKTIAIPVAIMAFFFAVFEIWFKLPLPKGPLEAVLGLS
ncbi:MAG: tripartite tricarboxylate transporter TctB family protein [Burkholderiaceae bacterium]